MPDQTDIDDPAWMVDCQRCEKPFRRKSLRGAKPKFCEACKLVKKQENIDKLRANQGQEPIYSPAAPEPAEDFQVVAKVEPSWLDDQEAQELLVERQRREQGLDEDQPTEIVMSDAFDDHDGHTIDVGPVAVAAPGDNPLTQPGRVDPSPPEPTETETPTKAEVCIVAQCSTPEPRHVDRFCTSHWGRISLEVRGVLLGAPRGSAPFDKAVGQALRQLRG